MKLAFYAPLKAPDHPVPSGERSMARGLLAALQDLGAEIALPSTLRSRDGAGDTQVQADLIAQAEALLPDIIAQGRAAGWQAWLTYHNYYKAPDLLGPAVVKALNIPYLQVESTRARKRLGGPWDAFARLAEDASDAADVILYLTHRDAQALQRDAPDSQRLIHLRPFLDRVDLPAQASCDGPMLAVGMMRAGDKAASYRIIAETLALLGPDPWHMQIAGDGPARPEIAAMMHPFGGAVTFLGALDAQALAQAYHGASLLFWPGANEAFGMTYLEAQAAGLPVIAQDRPGVRDVLAPAAYPIPKDGPQALADMITEYTQNPALRRTAGLAARTHVADCHLRPAATDTLRRALATVGVLT